MKSDAKVSFDRRERMPALFDPIGGNEGSNHLHSKGSLPEQREFGTTVTVCAAVSACWYKCVRDVSCAGWPIGETVAIPGADNYALHKVRVVNTTDQQVSSIEIEQSVYGGEHAPMKSLVDFPI
ncbi:hypothetical protein ACFWU5_28765 [Nocardia sp. NPDC058640]|uniref:hypothetical protein n=1 Tax=Nocardia sp. NPDC058640 TaxID=3346571 RepID=UPI00365D44B7